MRLPASFGSSVLLVGLFALGCAGASGSASREGESGPPGSASAAAASPAPSPAARTAPAKGDPPPRGAAPFDDRFVDEVRAVVAAYEGWGRVDDEMRFAPYLCRMPLSAKARWSESGHEATHGEKLYTLYALDPVAYGAAPSAMGDTPPLPGLSQVIVKESFAAEPLESQRATEGGGMGMHRLRPAERDGRRFAAGERKGLYVMMKVDGATEGTDAGWVYATVEPDMITVTAVGVIDSCAGCHAEAGDDRLFGLPGLAAPASHAKSANGASNAVPL